MAENVEKTAAEKALEDLSPEERRAVEELNRRAEEELERRAWAKWELHDQIKNQRGLAVPRKGQGAKITRRDKYGRPVRSKKPLVLLLLLAALGVYLWYSGLLSAGVERVTGAVRSVASGEPLKDALEGVTGTVRGALGDVTGALGK